MTRFLLTICFLWLATAPCIRLEADGDELPPRLRFLFIDETAGAYWIGMDAGLRRVGGEPYAISPPYVPKDRGRFAIYKTLPAPDGKSAPAPVKIATVAIAADIVSALVVVTPRPRSSPEAALDYRVEIIDDSPEAFPAGSLRVINRSPANMAGEFGGELIRVSAGAEGVVRPKTDGRHRLSVKVAAEESSGWRLLVKNITAVRPDRRMTGLLVYSPGGMRHLLTAEELSMSGEPGPCYYWLVYSDTP